MVLARDDVLGSRRRCSCRRRFDRRCRFGSFRLAKSGPIRAIARPTLFAVDSPSDCRLVRQPLQSSYTVSRPLRRDLGRGLARSHKVPNCDRKKKAEVRDGQYQREKISAYHIDVDRERRDKDGNRHDVGSIAPVSGGARCCFSRGSRSADHSAATVGTGDEIRLQSLTAIPAGLGRHQPRLVESTHILFAGTPRWPGRVQRLVHPPFGSDSEGMVR